MVSAPTLPPACQTLLGYVPEEMLAITTREAVHPHDLERILDLLWRTSSDDPVPRPHDLPIACAQGR